MVLADSRILEEIDRGNIIITPYDRECLGSNSYDVHLSRHLAVYENPVLDAKEHNKVRRFEIPGEGFVFTPGELYLGSTIEYTETHGLLPFIDGKSSVGRLGISIHETAGKGDAGFNGFWTLEITVNKPVRVYEGMPIGQLFYNPIEGKVLVPYNKKPSQKYANQEPRPKESMMFENFDPASGKWK